MKILLIFIGVIFMIKPTIALEIEKNINDIIYSGKPNSIVLKNLEKHSEIGGKYSYYLRNIEKATTKNDYFDDLILNEFFNFKILKNYRLFLKKNNKILKDEIIKLIESNNKYYLYTKESAEYKLILYMNMIANNEFDDLNLNNNISNLRTFAYLNKKLMNDYLIHILSIPDSEFENELKYWKIAFNEGVNICKSSISKKNCINELKFVFNKYSYNDKILFNLLCETKLIQSESVVNVNVCHNKEHK